MLLFVYTADFFLNEPGRRAADYIKKKMKAQIEQYKKKKRKTQQPNTKPLNKHITLLNTHRHYTAD